MASKHREVMCLRRLQETTQQADNIVSFLRQEGLIDDGAIRSIYSSPDKIKFLHDVLVLLAAQGKLQLLHFEWTVLPVESIRVHIVTDKNHAEFTFSER